MAKITTYAPKVDVEGAFFKTVPKGSGGFEFDHAGCEFKQLESTDGKKTVLILAMLTGAKDGKPRYVVMSPDNFGLYAHNADTLRRMVVAWNDSAKARLGAKLAECAKSAETLKGAGLSTVEIKAILKSRGHAESDIMSALKVEEVTEDSK